MKNLILFSTLFLLLTSFSLFHKKWIKSQKANIVLFSRPIGYSNSPSPDSIKIKNIIQEGIDCIKEINEKLEVNYNTKVNVYLYNYDEAEKEIGTNGGGGAIPRKQKIYFTNFEKSYRDTTRHRNQYIGLHEYVHIVSFNSIGESPTRLFAEGYANAVDGTYGGKAIEYYLKLDKMKSPKELLDSEKMFEGYFYPQSGFFIRWLFKEYSVKKINKLFVLERLNFEKEFEKITGDSFDNMENKYTDYIKLYFSKI